MPGFREALLTKVLCMVEPTRFLPINKYTGHAGKKEIAKWVYDLDLPRYKSVSWTIGRLIIWSNDLLLELAGDGFTDTEHAAGFLWFRQRTRCAAKHGSRRREASIRSPTTSSSKTMMRASEIGPDNTRTASASTRNASLPPTT